MGKKFSAEGPANVPAAGSVDELWCPVATDEQRIHPFEKDDDGSAGVRVHVVNRAPVPFAQGNERLVGRSLETHGASDAQQIVEVNEALERLEERLPTAFKVFELHYFMGWELKEIAEDILQIPYSTVKRQWQKAQAYLHRELQGED